MERIAVLYGGKSAERDVSLRTGTAIYEALQSKGYNTVLIDVDDHIVEHLRAAQIDVAFIALHGRYGEDGTIQGLLELLGIPYTGSGVLASALAMDKAMTKKIFLQDGIPTPIYMLVEQKDDLDRKIAAILAQMRLPLIVKPSMEGSSIGLTMVQQETDLTAALKTAFEYSEKVLIEEFVKGTEITVGLIGNDVLQALPIVEIRPVKGLYNYEAKYTVGMTEFIVPATLGPTVYQHAQQLAVQAHRALGCRGVSRVDMIIDAAGKPWVLEVNTMPGMTATSLLPKAARQAGIEFADLVEKILLLAVKN